MYIKNNTHPGIYFLTKLISVKYEIDKKFAQKEFLSVVTGSCAFVKERGLGKFASFFDLENDLKNLFEKPSLKLDPNGWWDLRPGTFIITAGNGSNKEYGCNMSESKGIPIPWEN